MLLSNGKLAWMFVDGLDCAVMMVEFPPKRFIHGARKFFHMLRYTIFISLISYCAWMVHKLVSE